MEDGRKAFEAMIEACRDYRLPFTSTSVNEQRAAVQLWHESGCWLPTEQHETVTAILERLAQPGPMGWSESVRAWEDAGKPGLPKPVDPYGPEITVDTGGRCPVEGDEVVKCWYVDSPSVVAEGPAHRMRWQDSPMVFRRILADHPGDSYWHGKLETIPESGKAGLDVMDWLIERKSGTPIRASISELSTGDQFRRWLKGDA